MSVSTFMAVSPQVNEFSQCQEHMASAHPRPVQVRNLPQQSITVYYLLFTAGWKSESNLPALGIEPRPSRARGGNRNHSVTEMPMLLIHIINLILKYIFYI